MNIFRHFTSILLLSSLSVALINSAFAAEPLVCKQSSDKTAEAQILKRLHFAKEYRDTARELNTTLDDLRFGAKTRAIILTGANSVLLTLVYARVFLLATRLASIEVAEAGGVKALTTRTLRWVGEFSKKSIRTGSYKKALAGDIAYSGGQLLFIETLVKKWGGNSLREVKSLGSGQFSEPRVLDLSPEGVRSAYVELDRQKIRLEELTQNLTPPARDKRNPLLLGWDDYHDFIVLHELSSARLRHHEQEVALSEYLLKQLRARCAPLSNTCSECSRQSVTMPTNLELIPFQGFGGSTLRHH